MQAKAKLDGAVPSSHTRASASDTATATSKPISSPVPQRVSHLTTVRAVRNQLSALVSTFKFPAVLDFDQSVLALSPNNAPVRAYENTLNGLLEQLDAIESDGDDEVRNVRREVVKEVEKALEDVERRVSEKAPKPQVTEDAEVKGYDVEAEALEPLAAQPVDATVVAETTVPTGPEPSVAADADVVDAIPEFVASPPAVKSPKKAIAELGDDAVAETADEAIPSLEVNETSPVSEDSSDSLATITATPASAPSTSPVPETFLASVSHDQFSFPPKPAYSDSGASAAGVQEDVALVDSSEEGESVKSGEDGWSEVDA